MENEELLEQETIEQEPIEQETIAQEVQETPQEQQFYPTREEYYLTPFLLCILILMLFLKWCFPMKGGKSI